MIISTTPFKLGDINTFKTPSLDIDDSVDSLQTLLSTNLLSAHLLKYALGMPLLYILSNEVTLYLYVLCPLMKHMIVCYLYGGLTICKQLNRCGNFSARHLNNPTSQISSDIVKAMLLYSVLYF